MATTFGGVLLSTFLAAGCGALTGGYGAFLTSTFFGAATGFAGGFGGADFDFFTGAFGGGAETVF